jgi:hypothetical protein
MLCWICLRDEGSGREQDISTKGRQGPGARRVFRVPALGRTVEKAAGDRERTIMNVCRLYGVNRLDALPSGV